MPTYDELGATNLGAGELTRDRSHQVFGQVMGLVAFTFGFAALGAYVGRNLTGGTGILFFIGAFACIFGLNIASSRGHEQLSVALLFGLGLLLGLAIAPVINAYANADPAALWQAAGATRRVRRGARRDRLRDPARPFVRGRGPSSGRCSP